MKIEIELHDSRHERPNASGKVLVFHASGLHYVYSATDVNYSAGHDQFNNYDDFPKGKKRYGEHGNRRMYWAYFSLVQEAVRKAVNEERRARRQNDEIHKSR